VFDNTNVRVSPEEIGDPHKPADVRAAAARKGTSPDGFQFVVVIDLDPGKSAGGLATPPNGDVYVGNYSRWKAPLTARDWNNVARTAYHHEIAHHWGWLHDWTPTCGDVTPAILGFDPFIAPPPLFGWEDVDGDGVPEILDSTPYGRSR
jgi:hypothetical protein